jgi:sugar/nucleoside kinase (ribokinase family)
MMEKRILSFQKYDVRIVDRVGSGDSFAAGFICGILDGKDMKDALGICRGRLRSETHDSRRFQTMFPEVKSKSWLRATRPATACPDNIGETDYENK